MKKILNMIIFMGFVLFPVNVLAQGYISASPVSLTIEQGSSKTFTITAYNTIGDVYISSNNNGVASVNVGEWGTGMVDEKQTKTGIITVTGNSIGSANITLSFDAATFDGEDLYGQSTVVTVNVIPKTTEAIPPITQSPVPIPQPENMLSKNNNLKTISIEGYELVKVDNNNYTLSVTNDVTSINIDVLAEDAKAKVTGIGTKELQIGENNIEVIITSESGLQNKINIKVTRKDGYYIEDLDLVLKNETIQDADIIINADSIITQENLNQIKNSKKIIRFNYYGENQKLLYVWFIDGKQIKESKEFSTSIEFTADNLNDIYKISNYADGIYIKFKHEGALPEGTKVKLYVADKYTNGKSVNLYHYNKNGNVLEFIKKDLIVTEGYIEFDLNHCSDYFVTMSTIGGVTNNKSSSSNGLLISLLFAILIIIGLVIFISLKLKPRSKNNLLIGGENTDYINQPCKYSTAQANQDSIPITNNYSNVNTSGENSNNNIHNIDNITKNDL